MMKIQKQRFGTLKDGREVLEYTLSNDNNMSVKLITYGGIISQLHCSDANGSIDDIVLGFDDLQAYLGEHPYFGAIIGRYGNRIAKGKFVLEGKQYTLVQNNGANNLHGGNEGFDKKLWKVEEEINNPNKVGVRLSYLSPDMEEGFPGNLKVHVTYLLDKENQLKITYEATTDKTTHVNLTNHSYFNLAGQGRGDIYNHEVEIYASKYTEPDENLIPKGIVNVEGTDLDFRNRHKIGERIENIDGGGYDHNYVLDAYKKDAPFLAAKVFEPNSQRIMEVYTTEPGVQFYTGNFIPDLQGKNGKKYHKHAGLCLETQHFPDSPNQPDFPTTVLKLGEKYTQTTIYKFSII